MKLQIALLQDPILGILVCNLKGAKLQEDELRCWQLKCWQLKCVSTVTSLVKLQESSMAVYSRSINIGVVSGHDSSSRLVFFEQKEIAQY